MAKLQTDVGNAQYLVKLHGKDLRYCLALGKWLVWDEVRWKFDDTGEVQRRAKQTAREMLNQALKIEDIEEKSRAVKHALRSENRYRLDAMVEVAKTESRIVIRPDEIDKEPYLLNCRNGVLDLRNGQLSNHRRTDLLMKLSPTDYEPFAICPVFNNFLARIMGGDQELMAYVQRCIGYSLTGYVTEKALFILVGKGDNGKTTLLEAIRNVLGDYAGQIPIESLTAKQSGGIPNDVARLKGLRFVTSSEVEQGGKLAEAKVKQMTGMGTLQARLLYKEFFEFEPTHKIFMDTNHMPEIRGGDPAIWNRLKVIPFKVSIPDSEKDKNLLEKLKAEASGILAWAVRGCLDWQKNGLGEPSTVSAATSAYKEEMDAAFHEFVGEACELGEDFETTARDLYKVYVGWCLRCNVGPESPKWLGTRLGELCLTQGKLDGQRSWKGIGLKVQEDPAKAA